MFADSPNEQCWVLIGGEDRQLWWATRRRHTHGAPATVVGDAAWMLRREETHGDVIGTLHTHPTFPAVPSTTDLRTMRAWVDCFGKDLLCVINGTDGLRAWWICGDTEPVECQVMAFGSRHGNLLVGSTGIDGFDEGSTDLLDFEV